MVSAIEKNKIKKMCVCACAKAEVREELESVGW